MILLRKQPAMCMRDTGVTGWNSYVCPRFRENSHGIDAARYSVSPLKTTVCTAKGCVCCCFYRRGMIQIRRHNNILGGQKYDLRKNRTRNLTITLRVTSSERELFLRGAEKRNMTLTDFLVSAALYKPSHAIKECKAILKKLNEVQAELLRAESDHPDYADVLAAQKELYQLLFLLARKETI